MKPERIHAPNTAEHLIKAEFERRASNRAPNGRKRRGKVRRRHRISSSECRTARHSSQATEKRYGREPRMGPSNVQRIEHADSAGPRAQIVNKDAVVGSETRSGALQRNSLEAERRGADSTITIAKENIEVRTVVTTLTRRHSTTVVDVCLVIFAASTP
jgi:hypothetical protein